MFIQSGSLVMRSYVLFFWWPVASVTFYTQPTYGCIRSSSNSHPNLLSSRIRFILSPVPQAEQHTDNSELKLTFIKMIDLKMRDLTFTVCQNLTPTEIRKMSREKENKALWRAKGTFVWSSRPPVGVM